MYITDTSSQKTRHHKSVIGKSHMNQKENMSLSNDPRKLPLDHIHVHYSSVEKVITIIDVDFKGMSAYELLKSGDSYHKVCDKGYTQNRCLSKLRLYM